MCVAPSPFESFLLKLVLVQSGFSRFQTSLVVLVVCSGLSSVCVVLHRAAQAVWSSRKDGLFSRSCFQVFPNQQKPDPKLAK